MVPDGNKAKRPSSVNHSAKTIHHHETWHFRGDVIFEWLLSKSNVWPAYLHGAKTRVFTII